MQHEDKEIVRKGLAALHIKNLASSKPPDISIEKTLDPIAQRAAQNIGLLLHDYLAALPTFEASLSDGDKLLKHWRKIMLEQPQRLAVAKNTHWHDDNTKAFWRDKIANHHKDLGITTHSFPDSWDDWRRASGAGHEIDKLVQLPAMQQKQWQDLIIQSRLHNQTVAFKSAPRTRYE